MKKIIIIFLVLLIILVSCGRTEEHIPSDIVSDILMNYGKVPDASVIYIDAASFPSEAYLSNERFSKMYFLKDGETDIYRPMLKEYAIYISKSFELFEIHIIKSRYLSDAEMIEKMFERRKDALKKSSLYNYCGEDYRELVNGISIKAKGKYVYMFITPDNKIAEAYIK
ncbi:MAG: DUF4358 domain-containing protein [Ruminococcaceae bacterium]|nr:DUF4358 domain-containing protein [Oscillospiraceae bacterium]